MTEVQITKALGQYDQLMALNSWADLFGFDARWGVNQETGVRYVAVDQDYCEVSTAAEGIWALTTLMGAESLLGGK